MLGASSADAPLGADASSADAPLGADASSADAPLGADASSADAPLGDLLRVYVREPARAGLREEVVALLPNALEVRIDPEFAAPVEASRPTTDAGRPAHELLHEYLATRGVADPRVEELFRRLHDKVVG